MTLLVLGAAEGDVWRTGVPVGWSADPVPAITKGSCELIQVSQPQAAASAAVDEQGSQNKGISSCRACNS